MLLRRKWAILLPTLVVTAGAAGYARRLPDVYRATALLSITTPASVSADSTPAKEVIDEYLVSRLAAIVSRPALDPLLAERGLRPEGSAGGAAEALAERIGRNAEIESVRADENNVTTFRISYVDQSRERARAVASLLAEEFARSQSGSGTRGETVKVIAPATTPESPIAPKRLKLAGLGLVAGLVSGLLLASLFELARRFKVQHLKHA